MMFDVRLPENSMPTWTVDPCPELIPKPDAIGMWVEYIAGRPRQIVQVLSLNQSFPSRSWWLQIPAEAPRSDPPKDSQPA